MFEIIYLLFFSFFHSTGRGLLQDDTFLSVNRYDSTLRGSGYKFI